MSTSQNLPRKKAREKKPRSVWYEMATPPAKIVQGYEGDEDECVATLLQGIPEAGGSASKEMFERIVRTAFQGGLVAATRRRN